MGCKIIKYDAMTIVNRSDSQSVMLQIEWFWDGVVNAKVARYGPVSKYQEGRLCHMEKFSHSKRNTNITS